MRPPAGSPAFQMFSSKLIQPVRRTVALWSQFRQANLPMRRLGDAMNAPSEPYRLPPSRRGESPRRIEGNGLAFRYGEDRSMLYEDLSLTVEPGQVVALMGPF